jgi:hypothetical protein
MFIVDYVDDSSQIPRNHLIELTFPITSSIKNKIIQASMRILRVDEQTLVREPRRGLMEFGMD